MLKKLITWFFMSLGVLFLILLLVAAYLWVTDPWGIKPFIQKDNPVSGSTMKTASTTVPTIDPEVIDTDLVTASTVTADLTDKHPSLTTGQEDALELIGIDPGVLPTEITPKQEACFVTKLGAERVMAIKAGATPEVLEIFKAKECMSL